MGQIAKEQPTNQRSGPPAQTQAKGQQVKVESRTQEQQRSSNKLNRYEDPSDNGSSAKNSVQDILTC